MKRHRSVTYEEKKTTSSTSACLYVFSSCFDRSQAEIMRVFLTKCIEEAAVMEISTTFIHTCLQDGQKLDNQCTDEQKQNKKTSHSSVIRASCFCWLIFSCRYTTQLCLEAFMFSCSAPADNVLSDKHSCARVHLSAGVRAASCSYLHKSMTLKPIKSVVNIFQLINTKKCVSINSNLFLQVKLMQAC